MDCRSFRERSDALLDGVLTAAEAGEMEAHLEACPACAAHFTETPLCDAEITSLLRREAPVALRESLLAATDRPALRVVAGEKKRTRPLARWLFAGAQAAAVVALVWGLQSWFSRSATPSAAAFTAPGAVRRLTATGVAVDSAPLAKGKLSLTGNPI